MWSRRDDPVTKRERVLNSLISVEVGTGHTREHGIAADKSRIHYRARNHVGGLSRHRRPQVTECAISAYVCRRA